MSLAVFLQTSVSFAADFTVPTDGTLAQAITAANSAGLSVPYDIHVASNITATALSNINVSASFTGDSLSPLYIVTMSGNRFNFAGTTALASSINDLTLSGATNGAINNKQDLTLSNTTLANNRLANKGGAVFNDGGNLHLAAGNTFTGNQATGVNTNNGGGAIYHQGIGAQLTIDSGNTFTGNTGAQGGAIFVATDAEAVITGSTFTGNQSTMVSGDNGGGGAVFAQANTTVRIGNSTFTNNSANDHAGAVGGLGVLYLDPGNIFIGNSTLTSGGYGGAVGSGVKVVATPHLTVINSNYFELNTASQGGGGAVANGDQTPMEIYNSTFLRNSANRGGAFWNGENSNVILSGSSFTENQATLSGGVIYQSGGGLLTLDNNTFTQNKALSTAVNTGGGAIFTTDLNTVFDLTDNTFDRNEANRGGAIYNQTSSVLTLNDGNIFTGNIAAVDGGAIFNTSNAKITGITDGSFTGNRATGGSGGAIHNAVNITDSLAFIDQSLFQSNSAKNNGGALYNIGANIVTAVSQTSFLQNTADLFGGAVYSSGILQLNAGNTFSLNSTAGTSVTSGDGGAVYNSKQVTVDSNTFSQNAANYRGGAIYNSSSTVLMDILSSSFLNNSAALGGAIYAGAGSIEDTLFDGNIATAGTANGNGGAVYNTGVVSFKAGNIFSNNQAIGVVSTSTGLGGAIYNTNVGMSIQSNTFSDNYASNYGGAIHNASSGSSFVTIDDSLFERNIAGQNGGAINNTGRIRLTDATFTDNEAQGNASASVGLGGAIYNSSASAVLDIISGTFERNLAALGGALWNANNVNSSVTTSSTDFTRNQAVFTTGATGNGGAIYNQGTLTLNSGTSFTENKAVGSATLATTGLGGAVYNTRTLTANDVSFTDNEAANGGAIYGGTNTIDGSSFSGNQAVFTTGATGLGGAIYNNGLVLTLNAGNIFTGNKAIGDGTSSTGLGGAIYNAGLSGKVFVSDNTFDQNEADFGGAIANTNNANSALTVDGSSFDLNTATYDGGVIYNPGTVTLNSGNSFTHNSAGRDGGAIYNTRTLTVNGGNVFSDNSAGGNGGAIYNASTVNLVSGSGADITFSGNTATGLGADIYNSLAASTVNVSGSAGVVSVDGGIAGIGKVNKSNAGTFVLDGDNSGFTGTFAQTGGLTTVKGIFFGGVSTVANATLDFVQNSSLAAAYSISLGSNGILKVSGDGPYVFGTNISNTSTAASIQVVGTNSAFDATLTGYTGNYLQNAALSTAVLRGTLGGAYSIQSGYAEITGSVASGKSVTTGAAGTIEFTGASASNQGTISGTGTMIVSGMMTNTGSVSQNTLTVGSGASFTTNASLVTTASAITNSGSLVFTGGTNNNAIDTTGTLTISGATTNAGIIQNAGAGLINIASNFINTGQIYTLADKMSILSGSFANNGIINWLGGTNAISIGGSGDIIIPTGVSIANTGTLAQDEIKISTGGGLTTYAGLISTQTGIANNGILTFTDLNGNNTNAITGSGSLMIDGQVNNLAAITQDNLLISNASGRLSTNPSNLFIANGVTNEGVLTLNGTSTLLNDISGVSGETIIAGSITNGAFIQQQKLTINSGGSLMTDGSQLNIGSGGIVSSGLLQIDTDDLAAPSLQLIKTASSDVPTLSLWNIASQNVNLNTLDTQTGSKTKLDVFIDGTNDKINVAGAATLDGEMHVRAGVGQYDNATFTIVDAGSLSGDLIDSILGINPQQLAFFDASSITDSNYVSYFSIVGNTITVFLNGYNASSFASLSGLTFNQENVGKTLDILSYNASGDRGALIDGIIDASFISEEDVKEALSALSPYFIANILRTEAKNGFRNDLYNRMRNFCPGCSGNGLWVQGHTLQDDYAADDNSINNFKQQTYGVTVGFDRYYNDTGLMLGVYGSYVPSTAKQNGSTADVNSFSGGLYGGKFWNPVEFRGFIDFSYNSYDTHRRILQETAFLDRWADASFNGLGLQADMEFGYGINLDKEVRLTPYIGVNASILEYGDIKESGAGAANLDIHRDRTLGVVARAGVGIGGTIGKKVHWQARGEYGFNILGYDPKVTSRFVDSDVDFEAKGAEIGRHSFGLNFGADYSVTKNLTLYIDGGVQAASGYSGFNGTVGLRYAFCDAPKPRKTFEEMGIFSTSSGLVLPATAEAELKKIETVHYAFDKSALSPETRRALDAAVVRMKEEQEDALFVLIGHADATGPSAYNKKLSERRAKAAAAYLQTQGVPADRIKTIGRGEGQPVASNKTREGRGLNRRVDVYVE